MYMLWTTVWELWNTAWHKEAGSNMLVIRTQFRIWCSKRFFCCCYLVFCLVFLLLLLLSYQEASWKSIFSCGVTSVTKEMFLSHKSCSLGTRCMIAVAGSQSGRKAQTISVRKQVKRIDRCIRICKCPVGIDSKDVLERGYFCAWIFFFGNTTCGHTRSFVGKMTTEDKKPLLLTGSTGLDALTVCWIIWGVINRS